MGTKDFWKALKELNIRDNCNHGKIIILLNILWDIDRSKNKDLYKDCNTTNEAIEAYKEANNFANMIRESCI